MHAGRNPEQRSADRIEEQPGDHQPGEREQQAEHSPQARALRSLRSDERTQTLGTDDAILVFGDALAAERSPADGAPRHRFAEFVVKTTLLDGVENGCFLSQRFTFRSQPRRRARYIHVPPQKHETDTSDHK